MPIFLIYPRIHISRYYHQPYMCKNSWHALSNRDQLRKMRQLQGRSQDFQRGGRFFIEKGKAVSEHCLRTFMRLFGTGVPGGFRGEAPEDIPFPCIWKPQIARKLTSWMLFFSLNFSNTMTTFMATFMATLLWRLTFKFLFLFFPLWF